MVGSSAVILRGVALHRGGPAEVRISRAHAGEGVVVAQRGAEARLEDLRVVRADRGVAVASGDGRVAVDLIEHVLAAIGGLGVGGVRIATDDAEIPLLDGGARRFADALAEIGAERAAPRLRVMRAATLRRGSSVYRFTPGDGRRLRVEVEFPAPIGREAAEWGGDPRDFVARIAPARTFGWVSDREALRAAGRAAEVDLASVLVLDALGAIAGCRAAGEAEVARHKLLDLIGDLTLHGGPPIGAIDAHRPGHEATHAIVREALAEGVLACEGAT